MHANVSLWKAKSRENLDTIVKKAEAELVPKLRQQPGFISFEAIVTDDDTLILVHNWESKELADKGVRPLVPWLLKNAATKFSMAGRHSGAVVVTASNEP
jgi:heme-degrading monooxygenase HmoA